MLRALLLGMLAWTSFKGLAKVPDQWAVAHYLLNYEHGIVRRGFVGQLMHPFLGSGAHARGAVLVLAYAAHVAFLGVVALYVVRRSREVLDRMEFLWLALVCASPLVWNTSMCLGSFDAQWITLLMCAIMLQHRSPALATALAALAATIHEAALLFVGLAVAVRWLARPRRHDRWIELAFLSLLTLWVSWLARHPPSDALVEDMLGRGAVQPGWIVKVTTLLRQDLLATVRAITHQYATLPELRVHLVESLLRFGLPTWVAAWCLLQSRAVSRWQACAVAALVLAPLGSLVMASDVQRLVSWTMLVVPILAEALPKRAAPRTANGARSAWWPLVLVGALLLTPPEFTYSVPMPRWFPSPLDPWMPDALRLVARAMLP
jgi:hypothetical protein